MDEGFEGAGGAGFSGGFLERGGREGCGVDAGGAVGAGGGGCGVGGGVGGAGEGGGVGAVGEGGGGGRRFGGAVWEGRGGSGAGFFSGCEEEFVELVF